jgi:biotin carboxylase
MGVISQQTSGKAIRGEAVVVVDPYSTGRFYLYKLKDRGFSIICVRSTLSVDPIFEKVYMAHKDYFTESLDFEDFGGLQELVEKIRSMPFQITAVIPGSDVGVVLGEELSEALGMEHANGTERLLQRTDKASMQDRLRECGISACEQIKSGDISELVAWASARGEWPLVAKPTGGCGSDGIFFCRSEEDLRNAHAEIVGKVNPKGGLNDAVALQEFLAGDEYIVDTISKNGKHLCVAIWTQGKRKNLPWNETGIITTENRLLAPSGEIQDQLVDYVLKVLDAFDYKHGPCHTEVMVTARGPVLIEVNCRMHGVQGPLAMELATGINKATHSLDIFVDGGKNFDKSYRPGPNRYLYPVLKHSAQLVLCSPFKGQLTRSVKESLRNLQISSLVEVVCRLEKGDLVMQSSDLQTSPGTVLMVAETEDQLVEDIKRLRNAESDPHGIYQVEDDHASAGSEDHLDLPGMAGYPTK